MAAVSAAEAELRFPRQVLADLYYCDGINAADINGDGVMDIIAGPYWYAGPNFRTACPFYDPATPRLSGRLSSLAATHVTWPRSSLTPFITSDKVLPMTYVPGPYW